MQKATAKRPPKKAGNLRLESPDDRVYLFDTGSFVPRPTAAFLQELDRLEDEVMMVASFPEDRGLAEITKKLDRAADLIEESWQDMAALIGSL